LESKVGGKSGAISKYNLNENEQVGGNLVHVVWTPHHLQLGDAFGPWFAGGEEEQVCLGQRNEQASPKSPSPQLSSATTEKAAKNLDQQKHHHQQEQSSSCVDSKPAAGRHQLQEQPRVDQNKNNKCKSLTRSTDRNDYSNNISSGSTIDIVSCSNSSSYFQSIGIGFNSNNFSLLLSQSSASSFNYVNKQKTVTRLQPASRRGHKGGLFSSSFLLIALNIFLFNLIDLQEFQWHAQWQFPAILEPLALSPNGLISQEAAHLKSTGQKAAAPDQLTGASQRRSRHLLASAQQYKPEWPHKSLEQEIFLLNLEDGYFGCQVNSSQDFLQLFELSRLCDGQAQCYLGTDELAGPLKCRSRERCEAPGPATTLFGANNNTTTTTTSSTTASTALIQSLQEQQDSFQCVNGVCLDGLCYCNDGYGGKSCDIPDENECKFRPCDVFAHCTNTMGSYYCSCFPGEYPILSKWCCR